MNTGMIQNLIGAGNSLKLASVSMNVYTQAKLNGDEQTMNRAMGYTINSTKQAQKYSENLEQYAKADQQENAEKVEAEKAEALAEKKAENKIENEIKKEQLYYNTENTDNVQFSEQAKQYIAQQVKLATKNNLVTETPKTYSATGEIENNIDVPELDIIV